MRRVQRQDNFHLILGSRREALGGLLSGASSLGSPSLRLRSTSPSSALTLWASGFLLLAIGSHSPLHRTPRMNSPCRNSIRHSAISASLAIFALTGSSCGGGDAPADSTKESTATDAVAEGGWSGMWIDDDGEHIQIASDGRFATFDLGDAIQTLRFHEFDENEYGERTIPTLSRKAGWEVEGDQLVSYKRSSDPAKKDERIAGRTFRRLTPEEQRAYWNASVHRLVREGRLDEILAAEAGGIDFAGVTDSSFTIAEPGQDVFVDMLAYAVGHDQRDVAEHFMEAGHRWRRPWTRGEVEPVAKALKSGDTEYIGRLCDHGLPLDAALTNATITDAEPAIFELLFAKGAEPTQVLLDIIDRAMPVNGAAVKPMFEGRMGS